MKEFSNLGTYLKQKRSETKHTQTSLAKKVGVHPQFVSNWERGLCAPPSRVFKKLEKTLSLNKSKLCDVMKHDALAVILRKIYGPNQSNQK